MPDPNPDPTKDQLLEPDDLYFRYRMSDGVAVFGVPAVRQDDDRLTELYQAYRSPDDRRVRYTGKLVWVGTAQIISIHQIVVNEDA